MSAVALIFERQGLHLFSLTLLLAATFLAARGLETPPAGQAWFVFAIASAVAHQGWVWLCWRLELHADWLSRTFGSAGFPLYGVGFAVLAGWRLAALTGLAIADRGSLAELSRELTLAGFLLLGPIAYLLYSVARYFTFRRALGADHFDPAYREMPLETRGIFRYTRNGMYIYGVLVVWLPGLFAASSAALLAAAFHHTYIWVHYLCTEKPDMRRIYGDAALNHSAG